jgi:putrescine transport system substrate-binding protein
MHQHNEVAQWILSKLRLSGFFLLLLMSVSAYAEEKVLNIYNWPDYIAPDTIANFEKETGIKVRYETFENNETLYAKLKLKKADYDLVMPSSDWAKLEIKENLLRKIDKNKLSNLGNLEPSIVTKLKKSDANNDYLVPWLWSYSTVGVNVDSVIKTLGKMPIPNNLWELLFNPKYTQALKSCGIAFLDSPTDVFPMALHYLGKPAYSNNPQDYALAFEMLKKVRADIRSFISSEQINEFANNKLGAVVD